MKKIILSSVVLVAAAALVVGATTAFFNDTETSTGNVFTAGSIDLTVDSFGLTRNGVPLPETSWFATDLTSERFFYFDDVKPGDWFGRSISIHVESNPAWVCLFVANKQDEENVLTDPEAEGGDTTEEQGELGNQIHVLGWRDTNPNGQHDSGEEFVVDSFFDVWTEISLHDSDTDNGPLTPEVPIELIQLDLCGGNHVIHPTSGVVSCDGSSMGNTAQTDILSADVLLYVEQHRNNPNFLCSEVELEPPFPG